MSRLALYKNHLQDIADSYPYLLDIQNDQLQTGTQIVALVRKSGKIAEISITTLKFSYAGDEYFASLLDIITGRLVTWS